MSVALPDLPAPALWWDEPGDDPLEPPAGDPFAEQAAELAAALPGAPRTILDVGAGSAIWSLAMAARLPQAHVVAVDLPGVVGAALETADALGVDRRRMSLVAGDYHDVVLPSKVGRIVVANVLGMEQPDGARRLLARLAGQLAPGGQLVIVEAAAAAHLASAGAWLEAAGLHVHARCATSRRGRRSPACWWGCRRDEGALEGAGLRPAWGCC